MTFPLRTVLCEFVARSDGKLVSRGERTGESGDSCDMLLIVIIELHDTHLHSLDYTNIVVPAWT